MGSALRGIPPFRGLKNQGSREKPTCGVWEAKRRCLKKDEGQRHQQDCRVRRFPLLVPHQQFRIHPWTKCLCGSFEIHPATRLRNPNAVQDQRELFWGSQVQTLAADSLTMVPATDPETASDPSELGYDPI